MPLPPIEAGDVDPRGFACPEQPYRLLIASHAPSEVLGTDSVVCGFCRTPWPGLRQQLADLLIAERDRARLHP